MQVITYITVLPQQKRKVQKATETKIGSYIHFIEKYSTRKGHNTAKFHIVFKEQ